METRRDALRAALGAHGFAVVRDLVTPAEINSLRLAYDRLVATAKSLPGTMDVGDARFVIDAAPFRLHRVVWCGGADPVLAAFGDDPRFIDLAVEALGVRPVVQLIQQAHVKLPGDGVQFGWHQDASNRRYGTDAWSDVDGRGSFVQIALAIDAMDGQNGGLSFIAGTHELGFIADPATGVLPAGSFDATAAVTPSLAPGDAVVFGPFVIHGSAPNDSAVSRRLFLQGYAAPGANRRVYPGCGRGITRTGAGEAHSA